MDRFECRKKLWADMEAAGLTIKTEPYRTQVPRSQRGGEIVEPMVSTQWFVKMKPMADMGLEAVRSGRIKIIPERFTKVYYNWLENIRDWCISRQLWWGHRIPAWHCADCGHTTVAKTDPDALRALRLDPHRAGPGRAGHLVQLRACGRSRRWAGPMTRPTCAATTRRR